MAQPTQHDHQQPIPPTTGPAWCAWHEAYSVTAVAVRDTSGAVLHACHSCREAYDLAPLGNQQ